MENFINNAPFALVLVALVIGFVLLIKGADYFVEGSSSVAKRLHVPAIIIGLTIVAMGTSLPETAVSVSASLTGNNELAVSNVVGSNIFNLMVVIGVCGVLAYSQCGKRDDSKRHPVFTDLCRYVIALWNRRNRRYIFDDTGASGWRNLSGMLCRLYFLYDPYSDESQ